MKPAEPSDDQPLSEADIQAYADGTLAPERAARLHRYLASRPGEAHRVAFYGRLNVQIRHAFEPAQAPFSTPALPASPKAKAQRRATQWRRLLRAGRSAAMRALLALALALVAASGWIVASQTSYEALNDAALMAWARAADHLFDAPSPLDADALAAAPDLAPAGLRLAAASALKLGPLSRASEFVYLSADGRPVVLLSTLALTAKPQPQWMAHRIGGTRLLTWTARRHRYVLAGQADTRGLMRAADLLSGR